MNESTIPAGKYDGWATPGPNGEPPAFPITADKDGWPQIKISLAVCEKGAEAPFDGFDSYQGIDPDQPSNIPASADNPTPKTPYEFTIDALMALGAESREAAEAAILKGVQSKEQAVIVPGVGWPKRCDLAVKYKAGRNGGSFMNVGIYSKREIPQEKRNDLAARLAARSRGPARGTPIAPPPAVRTPPGAARPTPIAPPRAPAPPSAQASADDVPF